MACANLAVISGSLFGLLAMLEITPILLPCTTQHASHGWLSKALLANTCEADIPEWYNAYAASCTGSVQALQLSHQVTSGHVCRMKAAVCKCQLQEEHISACAVEAVL